MKQSREVHLSESQRCDRKLTLPALHALVQLYLRFVFIRETSVHKMALLFEYCNLFGYVEWMPREHHCPSYTAFKDHTIIVVSLLFYCSAPYG